MSRGFALFVVNVAQFEVSRIYTTLLIGCWGGQLDTFVSGSHGVDMVKKGVLHTHTCGDVASHLHVGRRCVLHTHTCERTWDVLYIG